MHCTDIVQYGLHFFFFFFADGQKIVVWPKGRTGALAALHVHIHICVAFGRTWFHYFHVI